MSKKEIVDEAFKIYENGELDCVDSVIGYALNKYEEELAGIIENRIREIDYAPHLVTASRHRKDELDIIKRRMGIKVK